MVDTLDLVAKIAQVLSVPVVACGVLVSLYIGLSTLRELRAERKYRIRPYCIFDMGGQQLPVTLTAFQRLRPI